MNILKAIDYMIDFTNAFLKKHKKIEINFKPFFLFLKLFFCASFINLNLEKHTNFNIVDNYYQLRQNVTSLSHLKNFLYKQGFNIKMIEKICFDIKNVLNDNWYDQSCYINLKYKKIGKKKYITNVSFFALGRQIVLNYELFSDFKVLTYGAKKQFLVFKAVVNKSFQDTLLQLPYLNFALKKNILLMYKELGIVLNSGSSFQIFYEAESYKIVSIKFNDKLIVVFQSKNGEKYFLTSGVSVVSKKKYFKKPLSGRISSHFGYRMHPVKKRRMFHSGVDFAACKNTPVAATEEGIVVFVGCKKGYGKVVILKHRNHITTLYAHLNKFGKYNVGSFVKAGNIIAYVGNTGTSTGYHLHYEISVYGKQINPLSFFQHTNYKLSGKELEVFNYYVKQIQKYS